MESKGYKRFATTEAQTEEKRLKLNAERTIKQNKAALRKWQKYCIQLYCKGSSQNVTVFFKRS